MNELVPLAQQAHDLTMARTFVGILATYFPTPELPSETMELWARELVSTGCTEADMNEAVRMVARSVKGRPVVVADLLDAAVSVRNRRLEPNFTGTRPRLSEAELIEQSQLFGRIVAENFAPYWEKHDPDGSRRLRLSKDPADRQANARRVAAQLDAEWRARQPAREPSP